jgi:hypothetical protein
VHNVFFIKKKKSLDIEFEQRTNSDKTSEKATWLERKRLQSNTTKGTNPGETNMTPPLHFLENQRCKLDRLKHGPVMNSGFLSFHNYQTTRRAKELNPLG